MSDICCDDCGKVLRRSGHKFGEARPAFISGKAARTGKVIERRTRSIRRGSGHGTSERWLGDVVADDGEAEATDRGNLHVDGSSCDSSTTITLRHFGAGERAPSTTSIAAIRTLAADVHCRFAPMAPDVFQAFGAGALSSRGWPRARRMRSSDRLLGLAGPELAACGLRGCEPALVATVAPDAPTRKRFH